MARSLSPGWSDACALYTIERGKPESEGDNAHKADPSFSVSLLFFLTSCSVLCLVLCPAGTLKQAGLSCMAHGHLHLLPHAPAVVFGFAQVPPKTALLISLVLQTRSLIKMPSWSLGDVSLFPCRHSRLS